ncbi:uncharacterized protein [Apostichopus japonicus]|uniref:uncharacterized protein isoform X1 n=1 Tax=Stichopus japonicus TaxID=307972 RepID=UPI003AB3D9CE
MMKGFLYVFVLATLVAVASSLDCYSCNDCQPSFIDSVSGNGVETCADTPFVSSQCVKEFSTDGIVNRRCGTDVDCAAEILNKCDEEVDALCIVCCNTDKCNGSGTIKTSAFVVLVVAVFHKFMF